MPRGKRKHRSNLKIRLTKKQLKAKRVDFTKGYARFRIRDPEEFEKGSFRTIDPGRKGHTKVVIGRPLGKKTTETQSVLKPYEDLE